MITTTDCVYLQFMSTWTVASSGCVLLLLEAWHFSWECRSWRPRFLTVISLRTRWPPTLVLRVVETLLATCSFRYHVTTGWGFPMTQETKNIMQILWFSQRCYWGFRPSWIWRCADGWGRHLTHRHNATSQKPEMLLSFRFPPSSRTLLVTAALCIPHRQKMSVRLLCALKN
jgi:hypothetical protein